MRIIKIIALIGLFIWPTIVSAWNIPGHMISGAIAYRELKKRDPKIVAKVISLLKKHPHYEKMFTPKLQVEGLSNEEKDLYLFMLAARWPDDIKWTEYEPKHNNWHYVNYPYTPPTSSSITIPAADSVNILSAYKENRAILESNASDEEKAIALCWLFHLIGDIHQPLHSAALFSAQFPEGDRGGNLLYIRAEEGGKPINLHAFWDGLLLGKQDFRQADNQGVLLKNAPGNKRKRVRKELRRKNMEEWATKESVELAKIYVYQEGKLQTSSVKEEAPVAPAAYIAAAKSVAEKQIVLAGYRITQQLKAIF